MLKVSHNEGFFSCCTVRLCAIINYYNEHKKLPEIVDSSEQFGWYKPIENSGDVTHEYFENYGGGEPSIPDRKIDYSDGHQYKDFKTFDFEGIWPFIQKYFAPSSLIRDIISHMETKYNIDYENICVLFYRGNDKSREMVLAPYNEFIEKAQQIKAQNPNVRFLVQSDETEFIHAILDNFPGETVVFNDEIRHITKSNTTVDKVFQTDNHIYSKYFLAITIIMSKCRHVVCMSGNCSAWIIHYRNNTQNVHQYQGISWAQSAQKSPDPPGPPVGV